MRERERERENKNQVCVVVRILYSKMRADELLNYRLKYLSYTKCVYVYIKRGGEGRMGRGEVRRG